MAVNYVTQKCTSCAGTKLEYLKDQKAWRCLYCGTLIERQEQADSMFTIKNVVRQSLLDVSNARMDSAQKNLVECEKIDNRYVGTVIAEIAYAMNMIIHGDINPGEQKNMFSQLKKHYTALCALGDTPTDEEIALYESFESSEIIGMLILVYDSLNATARRDFIYSYFDASEIYSLQLNTDLINYSLKNEQYDILDKIIKNIDNINKREALQILMDNYPDGEKKCENLKFLIENADSLGADDKRIFENYLEGSSDCAETKAIVSVSLCGTQARPSVDCLMKHVIGKLSDEKLIEELFTNIMRGQLLDVEIYTIFEFAVNECRDEGCLFILDKLSGLDQYIELTFKNFCALLSRKTDAATKEKLVKAALKFNITEKNKESAISLYLCEKDDGTREKTVPFLLGLIDVMSTASVEKYLFNCTLDEEKKTDVVKLIFNMNINKSVFHTLLSNYIIKSHDTYKVTKDIIYILADAGLPVSTEAALSFLCTDSYNADDKLQLYSIVKNNGVNKDDVLNRYISGIEPKDFDSVVFHQLLSEAATVTDRAVVRYLLEITDLGAAKVSACSQMLGRCYTKASDIKCTVSHNGSAVVCNIIQGYLLSSPDDAETAMGVFSVLKCSGDVQGEVYVNGSRYKLKKYIHINKNNLDPKVRAMCSDCKLL